MRMSYRQRRAVSLVELTLSTSIAAVLMAGIASAMVLASHAIPDPESPLASTLAGYRAVEDIANELHTAQSFTEWTVKSATFAVADRDGDMLPETIRYAWSGTPGDAVTRAYNGAAAAAVAANVKDFSLGYGLSSLTEDVPGPPNESTRVPFVVLSTAPGLTTSVISSTQGLGEYFHPNGFNSTPLPADAVSWSVESVFFRARQTGAALGKTQVTVHPANIDGTPNTSTVLERGFLDEAFLPGPTSPPTYAMTNFNSMTGLSPKSGFCFTLTTLSDDPSVETQLHTGPVNLPGCGMLRSADGGGSWQINTSQGLRFSVYGRYKTPGVPQQVIRTFLSRISIALQVGGTADSRVETSVQVLNVPEVTP